MNEAHKLTDKEIRRYNRHLILPEIGYDGQVKIKQSRVLVVGAGGLGVPVLQYLTALGVGTIGISDNDLVEASNLPRQVLYTDIDIGKQKAIVAAQKLKNQNKAVDFQIHNIYIKTENILRILENYDLVIDCTDNFEARYLLNDACILANKPWIYGSIYKFEGQVSVFNYRNGPSYRCLYPNFPEDKLQTSTGQIGVLGTLPAIIGSIQASEATKLITGIGNLLSGQLLTFNTLTNNISLLDIERNDDNFKNITL